MDQNIANTSVQPKILVIEDSPVQAEMIRRALASAGYQAIVAPDGGVGLAKAKSEQPDLILLDIVMPVLNGYAVIDLLRSSDATKEIPVIFLTGMDAAKDEEKGLALGAVDYITKPINDAILLARVNTHLKLKSAGDWLKNQNTFLESEVDRRMKENELVQTITIRALARLAEIRDNETGNHIIRTSLYVKTLAKLLQRNPKFTLSLPDETIELLAKSAPLHDIGKVGVPDSILLKPGKLTEMEWIVMRTHAQLGAQALELAEKDAQTSVQFLRMAKEIAHWHHEKWDGTGYPDGLKWSEIPLSAKLMAVADVFDALVSKRVYKPAFSFEEAKEIMLQGRGHHFDPDILDAFISNFDKFTDIAEKYSDAA